MVAAEKWLNMVDQREYGASWESSSPYFRGQLTEHQWAQAGQHVRDPLGKLESRKLVHEAYRTTLPGLPKGQYVVMQFHTSFANRKSAFETVTTMQAWAVKWKVTIYPIG